MSGSSESLPEALIVVERNGTLRIEVRQVLRDGDEYAVVFARSDGTEARVQIDGAKLRKTVDGHVMADFVYQGGALVAPEQDAQANEHPALPSREEA